MNLEVKRNKQMAQKSIEIMKNSRHLSNFFVFGYAHYYGPGNILELVQKEGYKVLRVISNNNIVQNELQLERPAVQDV